MQASARCPRCGYPLNYNGHAYACGYCGYPRTKPPFSNSLHTLERELRSKVVSMLNKGRRMQFERMTVQYPHPQGPTNCISCGLPISFGSPSCPYCGTTQSNAPPPERSTIPPINPGDQRVLDYIIAHTGIISNSQASSELSLSPEALKSTIERLTALGLLKPT